MGNRTFLVIVRHGIRTGDWNTTPVSRRGRVTGVASTSMDPDVIGSSPPTAISNVDLPHPLGPRIETNSDRPTSIWTSRIASISSVRV